MGELLQDLPGLITGGSATADYRDGLKHILTLAATVACAAGKQTCPSESLTLTTIDRRVCRCRQMALSLLPGSPAPATLAVRSIAELENPDDRVASAI